MGDWVVGASINLLGSIAINFGTNLLKLGHDERVRHAFLPTTGKTALLQPVVYFKSYQFGIIFFALGNILNFISFGYAAQTLLAALGSIQFVSNIVFAYFLFHKSITLKVIVATGFIVLGNVFLVGFGNHQSPVYTPEQLAENYTNVTFLVYCLVLVLVVAFHHAVYRRGELLLALIPEQDRTKPYWKMLLPFSYAVVSGAVGSCSVLFAKCLSNLLRLSMSGSYGHDQLHTWFAYVMLLSFAGTAGFWMARLNHGLSMFDAIIIVPMFQIAWTFSSICTGFVYFQEYEVLDGLRTMMFVLGMVSVFVGISLLAPDESKEEVKDYSLSSTDVERLVVPSEGSRVKDMRTLAKAIAFEMKNRGLSWYSSSGSRTCTV